MNYEFVRRRVIPQSDELRIDDIYLFAQIDVIGSAYTPGFNG